MFKYSLEKDLKKKLNKLTKKDKILALTFKKKLFEVINQTSITISTYKNLRSPLHTCKRIHLTDNFILLFKVDIKNNLILFVDIMHWDKAYK
jgi:mRNA-degrading endonuclease RelE of RelBE toxin-antitoxin system